MPEEMIVRYCAPTLAGIKTGAIFTCPFTSQQDIKQSIRSWNKLLRNKGLRIIPLRRQGNNRVLLYVYRPKMLMQDLQNTAACRLLTERGYHCENQQHCILHLMRRLSENEEFPHEIGLFLGYPPEDVRSFIEKTSPCKCTGCWKVYTDEEAARKTFAKYRKCTAAYQKQYANGKGVERLAVAG